MRLLRALEGREEKAVRETGGEKMNLSLRVL
jgi:hypothetical protein